MKYEVTITRTGGIIVDAESEDEAIDKVLSMSSEEINQIGCLTGWEPSEAVRMEEDK
ncbi:MAG: hypothetical protein IJQ50_06170 [Clostridia bacterium]|nr:hypothetical protein [Clostridia bacterium]